MLSKREIKALFRSGSLNFAQSLRGTAKPSAEPNSFAWKGRRIYYRPGTGDASIINDILLRSKSEYDIPDSLAPKVILDIGGNIGASALYFARTFPDAVVHTFEPVPDNFALLAKNTAGEPNIRAHAVALGREDRTQEISMAFDSNFGSFSFYSEAAKTSRLVEVQIRNVGRYLADNGIDRVDLIKIDTEGAEYDILTALDPELLKSVQWITGELHGVRDFELLAYLSTWFDIGLRKSINKTLFMFHARNRSLAQSR